MNWNNLRFFLAVARTGKLNNAAKRLGVDHTTVSRRITSLEKELEEQLFVRLPKGYLLTQAGEKLMPYAEKMESESLALQAEIAGQDTVMSGTVRLATPEGIGSQFISPRLHSFFARYPKIELELVAESRTVSLSKREADIAITLSRPRQGKMLISKIASYRLKLYAANSYLSKQAPIITSNDLKGHPFIAYVNDLQSYPELKLLEDRVPNPEVIFRCTNVTGQAQAAASGLGFALLPAFIADKISGLTALFPEEIYLERDIWMLVHEDVRPLARVESVYSYLQTLFKQEKTLLWG
ncbi:LysR family transcriptional regulator [Temperatibacter marinus]|uniref:LysR family transcriptional regulator n=1 Tax=Temperatibacter marinus TaxID=1456591 RepID=A0AA52EB52_9PROT|nr:LysR family transcriptional regulator [Temperatibacter marinus]WND01500.1 LysR family transcriptional regulator [Temperatibacter marinus]